MNLTFLCKRQYMRKDVLDDKYARLYEIPAGLAALGHDVLGICLSYRPKPEGLILHESAQFKWYSYNPLHHYLPQMSAIKHVKRQLDAFQPDVLISASDALQVILGDYLAQRLGVPHVADLYDNYASFGLARLPGVMPFYRRALRRAAVVSCVSAPLAAHIRDDYGAQGDVLTLESTIDNAVFYPRNKTDCRTALNLPPDARLIGTAGALDAARGVEHLYEAWRELMTQDPSLHLVLAGRAGDGLAMPSGERVHYLGELAYDKIPLFWNALDVAVICIRETEFGRYSFPQKAYEILACKTPLIAAAVGSMKALLAAEPHCLYTPDDSDDLFHKLKAQLNTPHYPAIDVPTWQQQAARLDSAIQAAL